MTPDAMPGFRHRGRVAPPSAGDREMALRPRTCATGKLAGAHKTFTARLRGQLLLRPTVRPTSEMLPSAPFAGPPSVRSFAGPAPLSWPSGSAPPRRSPRATSAPASPPIDPPARANSSTKPNPHALRPLAGHV